MEVLGSAASILQVISFSADVLAVGYTYLRKVKNAPTEIKELLSEVASLNLLLDQIQLLIADITKPHLNTALQILHDENVFEDFDKLLTTIQKILNTLEQQKDKSVQNLGKRILWPFKEKETKDLLEQLRRVKSALNIAIAIDSRNSLKRLEEASRYIDSNLIAVLSILDTVRSDIQQLKQDHLQTIESEELLTFQRWLFPDGIDYETSYFVARQQRIENTGQWVFDLPQFITWSNESGSLLWVYGFAGSGKTVLSATIIDYFLQNFGANERCKTLWFFCDHRDAAKISFLDTLCSLVKQICDQDRQCLDDAVTWRGARFPEWKPPAKPLTTLDYIDLLRHLCSQYLLVTIIIDGLDEYAHLQPAIDGLQDLIRNSNINLLITSRHDVHVKMALDQIGGYQIAIASHMAEDIDNYISTEVRERIKLGKLKLKDHVLEQQITTSLKQKADGMILIAKLQLDYICRLKNDRAIRQCLNTLPSELYATYDSILWQIISLRADELPEIRAILQWLTYSIVPLTLGEVAEVISIQPEDQALDRSGIATDFMDLAASLGSLIVLIHQNTADNNIDDMRGNEFTIIALSHSSLEEYLKSGEMDRNLSQYFPMDAATVHLSCAERCLQYVSFDDFISPIRPEWDLFLRNWTRDYRRHSFVALGNVGDDKETEVSTVHEKRLQYGITVDDSPTSLPDLLDRPRGSTSPPHHIETLEDKDNTSSDILKLRRTTNASSAGTSRDASPVSAIGKSNTTEWEIEGKIETKGEKRQHSPLGDRFGRQTLILRSSNYKFYNYASRYWPDHLRASFSTGAINSIDPATVHLLRWFLRESKYVQPRGDNIGISEHGIFVSWQQMYHRDVHYYCPSRDPLYYAIDFRIDSLIDLLLPPKGKVNELISGLAPLHVAARAGSLSTVKKLLDLGAKVDVPSASDPTKMTSMMPPLHFAAEGGHVEVIKLLLQHGAWPYSRNESGTTAFMRAARSGSLQAMKVLKDAGCDINAGKRGTTALFEAVAHCRRRVACQLLYWGADPTIRRHAWPYKNALDLLREARNVQIARKISALSAEGDERSKFDAWISCEDLQDEIRVLGLKEGGPEKFEHLMTGLKATHLLLKQMEKDTRPGTEREKDARWFQDGTKIITMNDYQDRDDECAYV